MFKFSTLSKSHTLFFLENKTLNFDQFLEDVGNYRRLIQGFHKEKKAQEGLKSETLKVLLFHPEPYQFCVRLFALSAESADIYFPSNGQEQTINAFLSNVDAFSGQLPFTPTFQDLDTYTVNDTLRDDLDTNKEITWPEKGNLFFSTSGSTGQVKLVHKTWRQINLELIELQNSFNISAEHKIVSTVSHQHIYGLLFRLLWPLSVGAIISDTFEYPEHLNEALANYSKVTLISSPAFLKRLANDNVIEEQSGSLSHVFSSGGMLTDDVSILLNQQLNIAVTQVYGSTETGGIGYRQVGSLPASNWQAFSGVSLRTENESNRLILQSLWIKEDSMLLDDIGELISSNQFVLKGRADRTIKLEEKRVNLSAMESFLNEHEWVKESRILLKQGKRDTLYAVLSLTELGDSKRSTLRNIELSREFRSHLLGKFELVCLPKKWRFLHELPYNSQGKLVQGELEKLFE